MKNITLIYILLLSLVFISCNRNKNIKKYYQNGTIKSEYSTINNKIEGKYKLYYPSGALEYESNIKNGLKDGIEIAYYENRKLKMKGSCKEDKEFGFYYYYNQSGKIDSIVEYVLINDKAPVQSFINPNKYNNKEVIVNRHLIYDKKGEVDLLKSVYFKVEFFKDTIKIGDTLHVAINFFIQTKMKINKFEVDFYDDSIDKFIIRRSEKGKNIIFFDKISIKRGINNIKGVIVENIDDSKYLYWFFDKNYYVR